MLAPQYSLRKLLAAVAVSGVVCLIVAAANWGKLWAVAVALALFGLVILMLVHAVVFVLVWTLGTVIDRRRQAAARRASVAPS